MKRLLFGGREVIKASDLTLKDLIDYYKNDGERFLKEHRMIISSADAWGVLRRDLINSLGVQRAKRFLLRYGWHFGMHEARMFRNMFPWSDDLEWLIAGSRMHSIAGRVFSYPVKFDVDMKAGKFDVAGHWIDSFEAKQHLQHFSHYHEPICYFLVGYAGGYTSECLGKRIIFKEVECMGKGDSHCSYIGKTVEQWGDEIAEDLLDYEEENMADELDRIYRRVEQQKESLKLGSSISQKLMKALLQGKGLDSFVEIIGKSLHCPVVIENQHLELVASYDSFPNFDHTIRGQYTKNNDSFGKVFEELMHKQRPVSYAIPETNVKMLMAPIVIRNQVFGFITIARDHVFNEFHEDILERIATICALHFLYERTTIETEQRLKGELLEELLHGKNKDPSVLSTRLAYLGYNLSEPHYVLVFQIEGEGIKHGIALHNDDAYHGWRNKIIQELSREMEINGYRPLISTKLNRIHTIISEDFLKKRQMTVKEFSEKLSSRLINDQYCLLLGISNVCDKVEHYPQKYQEASKAIELAKIKKMKKKGVTVIMASELGTLSILLNARHPEELLDYADGKLYTLLEYDQKSQAELLKTLYYYAENEFNLYKTARVMNVSISGLRYRIQRIEELTQMDLSKSKDRFEGQLALQIYLFFGKLPLN